MGKKTATTQSKAAPAAGKPHISISKRTATSDSPGLGFYSAVNRHLRRNSSLRVSKNTALFLAAALQHGVVRTLENIFSRRALRGAPSEDMLTADEVRVAAKSASATGDLLYLPELPATEINVECDPQHEKMLVDRTRKAEVATRKRRAKAKAEKDAERAAGVKPAKKIKAATK